MIKWLKAKQNKRCAYCNKRVWLIYVKWDVCTLNTHKVFYLCEKHTKKFGFTETGDIYFEGGE